MNGSVIAYGRKEMICLEMLDPQMMAIVELVVKIEALAPCIMSSPNFRALGSFLCPDGTEARGGKTSVCLFGILCVLVMITALCLLPPALERALRERMLVSSLGR